MLYSINSPLEQFEINNLISITIVTFHYSLLIFSTFSLYITLAILFIYIIHSNNNTNYIIPNKWTISIEGMYSTIANMVKLQIGQKGEQYIPFLYSIFLFILFTNIISLVPYNFAIMAQLVFTISMSIMLWLGITILGLYTQKLNFFSLFVPSGCSLALLPLLVIIETLSYLARSISLGLRLGANILAGHLLLVILSGLIYDFMMLSWICLLIGIIPLLLVLGIMCLEAAIACIQAYVFTILTCSYIKIHYIYTKLLYNNLYYYI